MAPCGQHHAAPCPDLHHPAERPSAASSAQARHHPPHSYALQRPAPPTRLPCRHRFSLRLSQDSPNTPSPPRPAKQSRKQVVCNCQCCFYSAFPDVTFQPAGPRALLEFPSASLHPWWWCSQFRECRVPPAHVPHYVRTMVSCMLQPPQHHLLIAQSAHNIYGTMSITA